MNKNTFKFEVSFNLNTQEGETLDKDSVKTFKQALKEFVYDWSGNVGYFYAYAKDYDTDITPTAIKVKRLAN